MAALWPAPCRRLGMVLPVPITLQSRFKETTGQPSPALPAEPDSSPERRLPRTEAGGLQVLFSQESSVRWRAPETEMRNRKWIGEAFSEPLCENITNPNMCRQRCTHNEASQRESAILLVCTALPPLPLSGPGPQPQIERAQGREDVGSCLQGGGPTQGSRACPQLMGTWREST